MHADECSMKILWSTSLVCEKKLKEESCTIRDDKNHYCFDLTKLGAHKVKVRRMIKIHSVSLVRIILVWFDMHV